MKMELTTAATAASLLLQPTPPRAKMPIASPARNPMQPDPAALYALLTVDRDGLRPASRPN